MPSAATVPAAQPGETPSAGSDERSRNHQGVLRSAFVVGIMTVLSRILGLWRFRLLAHIFGATGVADAFNFAFVFPNLTRRLFGEGALTSAFVPVFSDKLAKNEHDAASKTGSVLLTRLTFWLSVACAVVVGCSIAARMILPNVMHIPADDILALKLFEAMLPYMIFINVSAVLMGILNAMGHFWMPSFAPVLLNVFMILACYFALDKFGNTPAEQIWAVAWAVLMGGAAQLLIQVPPAIARGFRFRPTFDSLDSGYSEVISNFKPVVLLVAVFQINVLMDNIIAKTLISGDGPVTYLNMGTSVYQLPWSIFSLAIGTALLPALSKLWALQKREDYFHTLLSSMRMAVYLLLPCTIGIMLLSEDLVRLLYGSGRFLDNDAEPVRRTAGVVFFSTSGLVFFGANALLARALYAMKDMKTPTTTSAYSVALNFALNLIFVLAFRMNESGIALASALSNAWQTLVLAREVRKRLDLKNEPALSKDFLIMVGGGAAAGILVGAGAYSYFSAKHEFQGTFAFMNEGFFAFFAAAFGGLLPFWFLSRTYFTSQLKALPQSPEASPPHRYNVPDEHWPEMLKFRYSLYSSVMASAVMGFVVWAVRDSLPPEGRSFVLVFQRAAVPVAVGIAAYMSASGSVMAREYEELRELLAARFRRS